MMRRNALGRSSEVALSRGRALESPRRGNVLRSKEVKDRNRKRHPRTKGAAIAAQGTHTPKREELKLTSQKVAKSSDPLQR